MGRSQLLELPAELRLMIWEYTLTTPDGYLRYDQSRKRFDVSSIGAGLLTVCHSVALETQYLPLQLNRLKFDMLGRENLPFLVLVSKLDSLEIELGWVFRRDVHFLEGLLSN